MKTKILCLLLGACLVAGLLGGCAAAGTAAAAADETAGDKLRVITTIYAPYDFVREIAGQGAHVEVSMLVPPGSESHSFEPTPQDIIEIESCDIFIYVGGDSDAWVEGILDALDNSGMTRIALMDLVDTVEEEIVEGMEAEHDHDEEDHDEAPELDEHVWTSPKNAITIVSALAATMGTLDEANATAYSANAAAYMQELEELDAAFTQLAEGATRTTLVFGDRFPFRYFADAYGLDYFAAFPGCSTETEPSAQTVAFLIDKVAEESIPVVFYIEMSNERMADTICEATGAQKLLLHSCHNVTRDEIEAEVGYLTLMWQNYDSLQVALY